jgi:prephenate dehydratase
MSSSILSRALRTTVLQRRSFHVTPLVGVANKPWEVPRVSILTEIGDTPGALHEILRYFWKYEVNLTRIESRPCPHNGQGFHIAMDFHGQVLFHASHALSRLFLFFSFLDPRYLLLFLDWR